MSVFARSRGAGVSVCVRAHVSVSVTGWAGEEACQEVGGWVSGWVGRRAGGGWVEWVGWSGWSGRREVGVGGVGGVIGMGGVAGVGGVVGMGEVGGVVLVGGVDVWPVMCTRSKSVNPTQFHCHGC